MKKVLTVLVLGALLLFMLAGCIPEYVNSNGGSTSDSTVGEEQTKVAPARLEPCPVSFGEPSYRRNSIGDEEFYVQITNNSDRPVKEVRFTVVFWGKDNLPIKVWFGSDEYVGYNYDNAMTPGETSPSDWGWKIYNQSGKDIVYSEIVVGEVIFFEGENWVNTNFDKELEQYVGKIRK